MTVFFDQERPERGGVASTILAIDPGNEQSAFVLFDGDRVIAHDKQPNNELLRWMRNSTITAPPGTWIEGAPPIVAVEMIASYGMPVGREVFETCLVIGRILEVCKARELETQLIYRQQVKLHHCKSAKANDATIRQALIDRFGGKDKAIGRKAAPGLLYGIKADEWSALAIALLIRDRELAARTEAA